MLMTCGTGRRLHHIIHFIFAIISQPQPILLHKAQGKLYRYWM